MILQPNKWSCAAASLAMLLEISFEDAVSRFGHDGSEIIDPNAPEPMCRRGFQVQEVIDVALDSGISLTEILACPMDGPDGQRLVFPNFESRIIKHMTGNRGLIYGFYAPDRPHMTYWDGCKVHDPMDGRIYSCEESGISKIAVQSFYLAHGIKS